MQEFYNKYSAHQMLMQPIKLIGYPKAKDKIDVLNRLKAYVDTKDIEYIYPLVFEKNIELASIAANIVTEIMKKVQGKHWNSIYDEVKYTKINVGTMTKLLTFTPDISMHLLGSASLNSNGFIREEALKLIMQVESASAIPYILLRLNDWVLSVRNLAEHILKNSLCADNVDVFIDNAYLVNKLQNVLRVNLKNTRQEIVNYLKDDILKDKIKCSMKHLQVKTRLFCYMLLSEKISYDTDIIDSALKDKSFEVRIWLVKVIGNLEFDKKINIIGKLLKDKSAKVKTVVLRNYENVVCLKFRESLESLVVDEYASVRDEARFIMKKHSFIKDFSEFYRRHIRVKPTPGALIGLGETGEKSDFTIVAKFNTHEEPQIRLASMIAMWYLSKDDAVEQVLLSLDSNVAKIRKTAKKFLRNSKMPVVLYEMKKKLKNDDCDTQLFALDMIYGYGGWHALEGILFAISNYEGSVWDKSKRLLDSWLIRSSRIYSKPDIATARTISDLFEVICNKRLLANKVIGELQFVIETRR